MEMRDKLNWHPGSKQHNSPPHRGMDKSKATANREVVCPDRDQYALDLHPLATGDNHALGVDD